MTVDASHPDTAIDFNRCILCELCVRASRDVDGKNVFCDQRPRHRQPPVINSPSGKLGDSEFSATDKAAHVCPVGAILPKDQGYRTGRSASACMTCSPSAVVVRARTCRQ